MGAYGAAILAKEKFEQTKEKTGFRGFATGNEEISTDHFVCRDCDNHCEVTIIKSGNKQLGCFSDRCGKYQ
jgi:hypothetical protein